MAPVTEESLEEDRSVRRLPMREMLRRMRPLVRPHRRLLAGGTLAMVLAVAAELGGPLVLSRLIDVGIAQGSRETIVTSALLFAGLFVVAGAAAYVQVVLLAKMGLAIVTRLKETLFHHLLGLSLAYFDQNPPGKLLARVESDTERLQMLFSDVGVALLRTAILATAMLGVMFTRSWQVTAAILVLATPLVVVTLFYFRWLRRLYRAVRALYARVSGYVSEFAQGVSVIQAFGYEAPAARRLALLNRDKLVAERNVSFLEYGFWGLLTAVEVLAVILIVWLSSESVLGTTMSIGTLVLFLEYARRAFGPIVMFSEQLGLVQKAFASADRVFEVLDTPTRTREPPDAEASVPEDWREIAFDAVSFQYDGGKNALADVSFRVRRGEKVALVGLSGGGKTTLTSLLLRYYDPTSGRIALDGRDIRAWRIAAWRTQIGLVLQDIHLFPGTVAENLRALSTTIPDEAVRRAVSIVGADDVIARLPGRYDEPLLERGANLSMGERQLLCFARALVRDPQILVLDEATSSVDPATERRLKAAVDRLLAGRTALIVAHRLATILEADRILVLHEGRLVEEGSHRELYALGGIYRDLFDLQFREAGATA